MAMKRSLSARDVLQAQCVNWYRKNGNECEFSVWRVIKLVCIYVGMEGTTNAKLISDAEMLAPRVLR